MFQYSLRQTLSVFKELNNYKRNPKLKSHFTPSQAYFTEKLGDVGLISKMVLDLGDENNNLNVNNKATFSQYSHEDDTAE